MEKEEEEEGVFMDLLDSGGLLLEMEGEEEAYPLCPPSSLSSSSSSATNSSTATQMLYFGADGVSQKSSDSSLSTLPSSPSSISTTTTTTTTTCKTSRKVESGDRVGGRGGGGRRTTATASATTNSSSKKHRKEASASLGTIKVRKEMLGERITALQQLVSPFSKSDTASVLHEALGYIRFLHDQVQVLSSPYLQRLPSTAFLQEEEGEASRLSDLRSRGLCLVPVSCTEYVGNDNGADFWSPAMGSNVYPKH